MKRPDNAVSIPTVINCTLDQFESSMIAEILGDYIVKNNQQAKLDHSAGKIDEAVLHWHISHSKYVENIATKLFPSWIKQND